MKTDNYLCINGRKVSLTEEQIKKLGINVEDENINPYITLKDFEKLDNIKGHYIDIAGRVIPGIFDRNSMFDCGMIDKGKAFIDSKYAQQVALHELLNRKLDKWAWENNAKDNKEWEGLNQHYIIVRDGFNKNYFYSHGLVKSKCFNTVYFNSQESANQAIEKVVMPFMKEHPDFVW